MNLSSFPDELCTYLASISSGEFAYGSGSTNLKLGELVRGVQGIFAVDRSAEAPSKYDTIEYVTIDFWAVNESTEEARRQLMLIRYLLHQAHHYNTNTYHVFFSHAVTPIMDMDRDAESRKLMKISVRFICTTIIS